MENKYLYVLYFNVNKVMFFLNDEKLYKNIPKWFYFTFYSSHWMNILSENFSYYLSVFLCTFIMRIIIGENENT